MNTEGISFTVTPASHGDFLWSQAGVHVPPKMLDSRLRGNDGSGD